MNVTTKPEGWGTAAPAPKLSKAKAAAAAKELEINNPAKARIQKKLGELKARFVK